MCVCVRALYHFSRFQRPSDQRISTSGTPYWIDERRLAINTFIYLLNNASGRETAQAAENVIPIFLYLLYISNISGQWRFVVWKDALISFTGNGCSRPGDSTPTPVSHS